MALNNVKINREYDIFVRYLAEKRHEELAGKRGAERKAVLDKWAESGRIQKLRSLLREIGNAHDTVIFDTDAEGITVIYAEPVEFAGTKKEFLQYLWDECAERVCRFDDRDCTGQRFTTNYKVGYLGNNLWRVAESFGYDF